MGSSTGKLPLELSRPTVADAELLAAFAAATFEATFGEANSAEDMAAYVASAFSPRRFADELSDPASRFVTARVAGEVAGYAKVQRGRAPDCVQAAQPVELARIYVAERFQGHGVGRALMQWSIDEARRLGADALWLGVWEHNGRARAFYERFGFRRVGQHDFLLGSDRQTDDVMQLPIR